MFSPTIFGGGHDSSTDTDNVKEHCRKLNPTQ